MAISAIQGWLDQPDDYQQGLQLYLQHGDNDGLKQMLSLGPTQYNRQKLYEALQALVPDQEVVVTPTLQAIKDSADPILIQLKDEWVRPYKELHLKKLSLPSQTNPEARKHICLEIMTTFKEVIIPTWRKLDYYREHGQLPSEGEDHLQDLEPLTEAQLWGLRQIKNLPPRISKAKKAGQQAKMEELEQLLLTIQRKMGYV